MIIHPEAKLLASDINPLAVRDVKKNLQKFPFREKVKIFQQDFFKLPGQTKTFLFMNPPYNKRIALDDPFMFYKQIGDTLKNNWQDSQAWIISANIEAMKKIGLHARRRISLNHGGTEAKLYNYEIYDGSKKSNHRS